MMYSLRTLNGLVSVSLPASNILAFTASNGPVATETNIKQLNTASLRKTLSLSTPKAGIFHLILEAERIGRNAFLLKRTIFSASLFLLLSFSLSL